MKKETKTNPPYIAVKKIDGLLERITSRSYEKIDRKTLMGYGFSDGESSQAVNALVFLGIVNQDKTVNRELIDAIGAKNEDNKIEGIKNMVEGAYADLFSAYPSVAQADTDDIHDEMKRVYELSPRIARTAVPAFVHFCELAGLRERVEQSSATSSKSTSVLKSVQKPTSKAPTASNPDMGMLSSSVVIDFADGEVKLAIPQKVMTNPMLLDDYKTLVSAVNEFVGKFNEAYAAPKQQDQANDNE